VQFESMGLKVGRTRQAFCGEPRWMGSPTLQCRRAVATGTGRRWGRRFLFSLATPGGPVSL